MKKQNIESEVKRKEKIVKEFLENNIKPLDDKIEIRGIGLIWGIELHDGKIAKKVSINCFKSGLIVERAGRENSIVKIMPALTVEDEILIKGLELLKENIEQFYK